jgi:hypothetical protein
MRHLYDRFEDWANVPVFATQPGRSINIRRVDILLVIFGVICVGYYGWVEGWIGALKGALAYLMVMMTALWVLR